MNIQDQIKVMQHFADGGEVEYRNNLSTSVWRSAEAPLWNWGAFEYRIKEVPKPKVKMWQALIKQGVHYQPSIHYYADEESAKHAIGSLFVRLLPHTEIEVELP